MFIFGSPGHGMAEAMSLVVLRFRADAAMLEPKYGYARGCAVWEERQQVRLLSAYAPPALTTNQ
jgi:hypothetical protein